MKNRKRSIQRGTLANVVGTIHTDGGFAEAAQGGIDLAEVRLDLLGPTDSANISSLPVPVILTVRRADEGGACDLPAAERAAIYEEYLPVVEAIDIEARSLRSFSKLIQTAKDSTRAVIVSYHDFEATPTLARLRRIAASARNAGADIVKIATVTETAGDVACLLQLLDESEAPLSVMGMGDLGRASRILFAKAGSVLNYGWLHQPLVKGQWSAREFAELLARA